MQRTGQRGTKEFCMRYSGLSHRGKWSKWSTFLKSYIRCIKRRKDRFLKRKQKVGESITEFAAELKDALYQAWPGIPRDQLEDLLIEYFVGGLQSPETFHDANQQETRKQIEDNYTELPQFVMSRPTSTNTLPKQHGSRVHTRNWRSNIF